MIIRVEDIHFSYSSKSSVLDGVTFEVNRGECVAILGVNGAGKSTLLKCINSILAPSKGVVFINGEDISYWSRRQIARHVAYVPQRSRETDLTVFEIIALGRRPYMNWFLSAEDYRIVDEVMATLDLQRFALKKVSELSGGEFQKVMIGQALAQTPDIFLLDEPTNHLDIKNQIDVMKTVRKITKNRRPPVATIVCVHDINLALRFADKLIFLKNGRIWATSTPEDLNPAIIREVYGIDVFMVRVGSHTVMVPIDSDEEDYGEKDGYPFNAMHDHYYRTAEQRS